MNRIFGLIQGVQEETLFERPDNTPRTLAEAIKETLNIDYDGQSGGNLLAGDRAAIERGGRGRDQHADAGERGAGGTGTTDSGGSVGRSGESGEIAPTLGERIEAAESETDTAPSEAQKAAGNYKKGHVQVGTFNVTIENPKGSVRRGVDASGREWQTTMNNTYGYIRGTKGVDGDHIDVFLSDDIDGWDGRRVYVIDQYNEDGTFDEHKVMLGFNSAEEALAAYLSNYNQTWADDRKLACTSVVIDEFEKWIDSSHRKTKPFAEYKTVDKTMMLETVETGTLLDVVRTLYSQGKEYASKLFNMKFFDVAQTPKFMQEIGLRGDKFTIKYGVISRHLGKDNSHNLSEKDWEQLPTALQNPFAITKLTDKDDSYRIYTALKTATGEYVVVGADVKNTGRDIEINAISTVFGRRNNANLSKNEDVIYRSEKITPEQSALLNRPNFGQYPTVQELPANKDTTNIPNDQETSATGSTQSLISDVGTADDSALVSKAIGKTFVRQGKTEDGKPYNETLLLLSEANGVVDADVNTADYGGHHRKFRHKARATGIPASAKIGFENAPNHFDAISSLC